MSQAAALRLAPRNLERRRHRRVPVALLGRYMLASREEYPCQTVDMSPGGVLLTAPAAGKIGERVVLYLEHLGRLEGVVKRHVGQGFAMTLAATPRKRDKIASQLTWLANRQALGLPEDRRHERVVPRNPMTVLKVESGREFTVQLIDVSLSGAAIAIENKPEIGAGVTVGATPGKVVRHFHGGIAVEFLLSLSPDRFDEGIVL
jgi:PilZ domain